jgi:hypothetical protein
MTEENKTPTEVKQPEVPKDTITVDIDGVSLEVPLETGKKIIDARQKAKKEIGSLKEQVAKAEASAAAEAQRNALMKSMRELDVEAVKTQVAEEYTKKIAAYETKIFGSEVKSQLAALGVLPEALSDAATLALQGAKVTLDADTVKINDKDSKEYLTEWIKGKNHLVAVKAQEQKGKIPLRGGKPPEVKTSGKQALTSGLGKLFKNP